MDRALDAGQRWQLLETFFHKALELPDSERIEKAREWCRDDPELLTLLLEMFVSDSSVERLLASTVAVDYGLQRVLERDSDQLDRWIGKVVGPFQIERLLGRGGMGVVYLGRRITGGFDQSAAIKLIARHLGSGPAVQHFHLERDALAKLDHTNIARLLDAGITADDRPYVAMDYVEGRPFDEACDDRGVAFEEKLRWMLQLCDAVAYVHRNLMLHRDLKPGNVMVTSEGVVKLLDFGTLKLIGPAAALSSDMTQAGMRPMTLRYASPEHIAGKTLSTASDVYSMGVILYRLVAGRLPAAVQVISLPEHVETLRNARLERPSSHRAQGKDVPKALRADLDAIASKALRFQPEQRYASVEALSADIQLCLDRRPVSARRGTARYRFAKFYARNRTAVLGTAAVLLVLAAGLVVIRHQERSAIEERQHATAGIQQERKLTHLLLFDYFEDLRDIPSSTDAQKKAATEAIAYLDSLGRVTQDDEIKLDIVQGYRRMGLLLGSPYEDNLGQASAALETLEKAVPLVQQLLRRDPKNLDYQVASIGISTAMAQAYFSMQRPEDALERLRPAVQMAYSISLDTHATPRMLIQCAAAWKTLADAYGEHANAATQDLEKEIAALQQSGRDYEAAHALRGALVVKLGLGQIEEDLDADRALATYQNAIGTIASLSLEDKSTIPMVRLDQTLKTRLAAAYIFEGRRKEADALYDDLRKLMRRAIAADAVDTRARDDLDSLDSIELEALLTVGDYRSSLGPAVEYLETSAYLVQEHPDNANWRFVHCDASLKLGTIYQELGDRIAAKPYSRDGISGIVALANQADADTETLRAAAKAVLQFRRDNSLDPNVAVQLAKRNIAATHPPAPTEFLLLAQAQQAAGLKDESAATAQEALAQLKAHPNSLGNALYVERTNNLLRAIQLAAK